jgi:predicted metalloprotease with PDZ domain
MAERFVCVRVQSMNGVNIELFQFDYDLTWMAFFMDSGDRFYARYGGRNDDGPESYLSKESLVRTMREALRLHADGQVQTSRYEARGEESRIPEDIPPMKHMLARREESCIHCHDVKNATLRHLQDKGEFSKDLIYTYPTPEAVGIHVDRHVQIRIASVDDDSPVARAGLKPGDQLLQADGQRILTVGDFARVLELTPLEASLPLVYRRDGETRQTTLELSGNWKRSADPSWRSSTEVSGPNAGFWAAPLGDEQRRQAGLPADALALRVTFLFPNHPTPREAELKSGDVVIALDGDRTQRNMRQFHAYCQLERDYGDRVPITILRDGREVQLTLPLRDRPAWKE